MGAEPRAAATASDAAPTRGVGRRLAAVIALVVAAGAAAGAITREEALALAYPGAQIRAERIFLTETQRRQAAELSGEEVPSALVARYVATREGTVVGRAYLDTHTVRTKRESLLVSLDADGRLRRIDVTAFLEPPEYEAPEPWLDQYEGRELTPELQLQRAIRPIAGATLTALATNKAARRVLAIDRVLQEGSAPGRAGGRQ